MSTCPRTPSTTRRSWRYGRLSSSVLIVMAVDDGRLATAVRVRRLEDERPVQIAARGQDVGLDGRQREAAAAVPVEQPPEARPAVETRHAAPVHRAGP